MSTRDTHRDKIVSAPLVGIREVRAELDHVALEQAVANLAKVLQTEGLSEPELDEISRDFQSWRSLPQSNR